MPKTANIQVIIFFISVCKNDGLILRNGDSLLLLARCSVWWERAGAEVHAGKDEDGAEEEPGGDLLVE
jgi:hypothetical protein